MSNSNSDPLQTSQNSELLTADVRAEHRRFQTPQKRTKHESLLTATIVAIYIDELDDPFFISLASQVIMGRNTAGQSVPSLLDLNNFEAFDRGVSRKHGLLEWKNDLLFYQDLGSSNGSFINDLRVTPQVPHRLVSGDVLELAKIRLQLFFVDRSSPGTLTSSVSSTNAVNSSAMSYSSPAEAPVHKSLSEAPSAPNNAVFLLSAMNPHVQPAATSEQLNNETCQNDERTAFDSEMA